MSTIYYHPKGQTTEQTQGLTEFVPSIDPVVAIIVGHGIGERNSGDLAGCKLSSGWTGFLKLQSYVDRYGVLQVYINTIHDYEYKEYQFAVDWILKKYPHLSGKIWVLGHSLGSYGAGKNAFPDADFAKKIAGWADSASGNFGDIPATFKNLVDNGCKFWGVTAVNDTASGTDPIGVTRVYDKMKALNPNAHAILTVFPATEWPTPAGATGSKSAHNGVLNRITSDPIYYSKGNISLITKGIAPNLLVKMNLIEWMISNPKGSIYQDPTLPFTGPKYADTQPAPTPEPIPQPTPIPTPEPVPTTPAFYKNFIDTHDGWFGIWWTDGSKTTWKIPTGTTVKQVYSGGDEKNDSKYLKIILSTGSKVFGPKKA